MPLPGPNKETHVQDVQQGEGQFAREILPQLSPQVGGPFVFSFPPPLIGDSWGNTLLPLAAPRLRPRSWAPAHLGGCRSRAQLTAVTTLQAHSRFLPSFFPAAAISTTTHLCCALKSFISWVSSLPDTVANESSDAADKSVSMLAPDAGRAKDIRSVGAAKGGGLAIIQTEKHTPAGIRQPGLCSFHTHTHAHAHTHTHTHAHTRTHAHTHTRTHTHTRFFAIAVQLGTGEKKAAHLRRRARLPLLGGAPQQNVCLPRWNRRLAGPARRGQKRRLGPPSPGENGIGRNQAGSWHVPWQPEAAGWPCRRRRREGRLQSWSSGARRPHPGRRAGWTTCACTPQVSLSRQRRWGTAAPMLLEVQRRTHQARRICSGALARRCTNNSSRPSNYMQQTTVGKWPACCWPAGAANHLLVRQGFLHGVGQELARRPGGHS